MGTIFVKCDSLKIYTVDTVNKAFNLITNKDIEGSSYAAETNNQYVFVDGSRLRFINKTTMATENSIILEGSTAKFSNIKGSPDFYCTIDYKPCYIKIKDNNIDVTKISTSQFTDRILSIGSFLPEYNGWKLYECREAFRWFI